MKRNCLECLPYVFEIFELQQGTNIQRVIGTEEFFRDKTIGYECHQKYECLPLKILKTRLAGEEIKKEGA